MLLKYCLPFHFHLDTLHKYSCFLSLYEFYVVCSYKEVSQGPWPPQISSQCGLFSSFRVYSLTAPPQTSCLTSLLQLTCIRAQPGQACWFLRVNWMELLRSMLSLIQSRWSSCLRHCLSVLLTLGLQTPTYWANRPDGDLKPEAARRM